jgi:predicted PurR-regulated permease PerM
LDEIRADREARRALIITDPLPVDSNTMWVSAGRGALIGIFLLLFGAFLYVCRPILLPILAAAVLALTLGPFIKAAKQAGIPTWATAILILLFGFGALSLLAMALARPVTEWIGRAPEIGASIKDKLAVLEQPLAALHELQTSLFGGNAGVSVNMPASNVVLPVVAFVTPAAGELVLFFTTLLFFLVGEIELRNQFVALFGNRDSKLRFLRIMRDIERNLAAYLAVVTIVNVGIAIIVSLGAWLIGFPNPLIFGLLAAQVD